MEVIQLPSLATKLPLNFKCCLIGSSGSGKSEFISKLIKYKDQVFQEPYDCFIYCSPNLGTHSSKNDLEFKRCLEAWSHPTKICFTTKLSRKKNCSKSLIQLTDAFSRLQMILVEKVWHPTWYITYLQNFPHTILVTYVCRYILEVQVVENGTKQCTITHHSQYYSEIYPIDPRLA